MRFAAGRFAAGLLLTVLAVVFAQPATADDVVKIVSSLPRTGSAKAQTDTIVKGIRMALDEAGNRAGPFRLEYLDFDDATAAAGQWTAEAESANAQRAVRDEDVMAYIGTYNSGAAKISMPILNRADLLMISPASSWPGLTKPGKGDKGEPQIYRPTGKINFVRVVPADDLQGPFSAAWAQEMGLRRVYILDDNEVYGRGIARLFEETCEDLGIEVLGHESIDTKAQEFKSLMTKIKSRRPDLIYFGGTTQSKGGQLAKDMVAAGLDCKIMCPDACMEDAFIESAGAENINDRCYLTFGGLPPDKLTGPGKKFHDSYVQRYGGPPEAYSVYGYEAAKVAIEAIKRAGKKDRRAIVDTALSIRDFDQGALGKWSFDENGDTTVETISGSVVHNGKFEFVKLLTRPKSSTSAAGKWTSVEQPDAAASQVELIFSYLVQGLTFGALVALIALGYTMVYGIVELINFAHGDVFMLGSLLALSIVRRAHLESAGPGKIALVILLLLLIVPAFCAAVNLSIDRIVYKPLRGSPKLVPLVSAIGVSFVLMNIGLLWWGAADVDFPPLVSKQRILGPESSLPLSYTDLIVIGVTVPTMIALTLLVKQTKLGKAMRACAQNPTAARLMGINVDRVIGATFVIGGALAGVASVIYSLSINTVSYQMGFTNGLYAFTAAVLGGIGNIPGAVLGGLVIGLVREFGTGYIGAQWSSALVFLILIVILIFRPTGLLGSRMREKV